MTVRTTPILQPLPASGLHGKFPNMAKALRDEIIESSADKRITVNNVSGIMTMFCHTTKQLIAQMAQNFDPNNRQSSPKHVDKHLFSMRNGLWVSCDMKTYNFNDRFLTDGKHRIIALSKLRKDMSQNIIELRFNVPVEHAVLTDTGRPRTLKHQLRMYTDISPWVINESTFTGLINRTKAFGMDLNHPSDLHLALAMIEAFGDTKEQVDGRTLSFIEWMARKHHELPRRFKMSGATAGLLFYAAGTRASKAMVVRLMNAMVRDQVNLDEDGVLRRLFQHLQRELEKGEIGPTRNADFVGYAYKMMANALWFIETRTAAEYSTSFKENRGLEYLHQRARRTFTTFNTHYQNKNFVSEYLAAHPREVEQ